MQERKFFIKSSVLFEYVIGIRGMTFKDFAGDMGIAESKLSVILNNIQYIDSNSIMKICALSGMQPGDFLRFDHTGKEFKEEKVNFKKVKDKYKRTI